ncbi:MAG: extracellular solute-binding protein [Formosimonas sp.]
MLKKLKYMAMLLVALCSTHAVAQTNELNVYNWIEYIPEHFRADFEQQTGARVNYDAFETDEVLNSKLARGRTGYDIVVPSATFAQMQIKQGRYQKLNKSLLPNLKNLNPGVMSALAQIDPDNQYLVPWSWGYTGVGVNERLVKKALGAEPMPSDSFELVFNPKYTRKLKSCGIFMLDSPLEILPVALHYLGREPNSNNTQDYQDVLTQVLKPVRRDIRRFGDSSMTIELSEGRYCVALAWAVDVHRAADMADNPNIKMLQSPHNMLFVDVMAIPADAKNVSGAHQWLDYSMRPTVAAEMMNELGYPTPNQAALAYVYADRKSQNVFPNAVDANAMYVRRYPSSSQGINAMNKTFRAFKLHE